MTQQTREAAGQGPTLPGGLAKWAWKAALRLATLKQPGVYGLLLIVRPDNTRELVIQNSERPHKPEDLGA